MKRLARPLTASFALAAAITLLALAACGKPQPAQTHKEWLTSVQAPTQMMMDSLKAIADDADRKDPAAVVRDANTIHAAYKQWKALPSAPASDQKRASDMDMAFSYLDKSATALADGLTNGDMARINQGMLLMDEGAAQMVIANKELEPRS